MKTLLQIIYLTIIFIGSQPAFAEAKPIRTLLQIQSLLSLKEGAYELSPSGLQSSGFCDRQVADIRWELGQSKATLVVGTSISFPDLELDQFEEPGENGCHFMTSNTISSQKLTQVVTKQCPNKGEDFKKTHVLDVGGKEITYLFKEELAKSKPTKSVCKMILLSTKGVKNDSK